MKCFPYFWVILYSKLVVSLFSFFNIKLIIPRFHFELGVTAKRFRPFAIRLFSTFLPPGDFILLRNPCFLARFFFFGCHTLFGITYGYYREVFMESMNEKTEVVGDHLGFCIPG